MTTLHLRKSIGRSPLQHGFLLIPLAFACFAAVFLLATPPAGASDQVPFNGSVSGQIPSDLGPPVPGSGGCVFDFFVSNSGNATVLGPFTGTAEFKPNLCDGSYTGFFHWIAANGDAISGPFFGQLIPTATQGVFDNNETAIVTGGTGSLHRRHGHVHSRRASELHHVLLCPPLDRDHLKCRLKHKAVEICAPDSAHRN